MSRTVKGIIAGVAVLVLLGGSLLALKLTEPKPDTSSSVSDEDTGITLYTEDYNNISSIAVTNENGGYTIVRTKKAEPKSEAKTTAAAESTETDGSAAASENSSTFTVSELGNVKLDDSLIGTLPTNAASLQATKLIEENVSDLSKYGLEKPKAEVKITFDGDNARELTLLVGDDTPAGDVYVCIKGENIVYSVSSSIVKVYTYEKEYFVSLVCIDKPEDKDFPIIDSVVIDRPDLEYDIIMKYNPLSGGDNESGGTSASHIMTSPVNAYLNVSDSVKYTHGMFGLKASSVLSLSPSDEELEFAGINKPLCTVTTTLENGKVYNLKIGIKYGADDGSQTGYTGYIEGIDALWLFNAESIPWVSMKPEDVMSSMVFGQYIYDVSSMTVVTDNETLAFVNSGDSEENYSVTLNGEQFDTERYKKFFQALIKAPAEEVCISDEGIGKRLAAFIITKNNGTPDETIEFYEATDRKVIIKKDSIVSFKCRSSFLTKALLPNIANIKGTGDFITNW